MYSSFKLYLGKVVEKYFKFSNFENKRKTVDIGKYSSMKLRLLFFQCMFIYLVHTERYYIHITWVIL